MKLTGEDYKAIVRQIEPGTGTAVLYKGDETLEIGYDYYEEGYCEESTNAYIITEKSLCIDSVSSYDGEGEDTSNDFDENKLIELVA